MEKPDYGKLPAAVAIAGKDLLLTIWDETGNDFLALGGQQSLTINRSADSIEVTSKDTKGGWKAKIAGMKDWGIDTGGVYAVGDEGHSQLSKAFLNSDLVIIRVFNNKTDEEMFGGLAAITDYPLDAPYDDAVTYSLTLDGNGPLVDLSAGG